MPASKQNIHCPVCGMVVDENSEFTASRAGEMYYFCSEEDKKEFQKNPNKYIGKEKKAA